MNHEALYHRHKQNWAFAYDRSTIYIRLRAKRDDIEKADVCYGDKYDWHQTEKRGSMIKLASDSLYDYWEAAVHPPYGRLSYRFHLQSGDEQLYYGERWCKAVPSENSDGNFEYPYLNRADLFVPPEWVKDAVFYQIFPERFANGDKSRNPARIEAWGGKPEGNNYFGGDLQGVIDHLDHLVQLGVNAIYFTPLFEADTNHKYDTKDYLKVDPHFGTNALLRELVEACHRRGIRVLLDIVFNHCGDAFPPFADVLEKGESSRYADWFLARERPLQFKGCELPYETFSFEPNLPKFNTANPEVSEYLLNIADYWIRTADIDGYRLDVANEVDHRFWRKLREVVKAAKPDAYIVGEIMHDSMAWLGGDQLDAVMNYPVRDSVIKFFARRVMDGKEFADSIGAQLAAYPLQAVEASFQVLGSHDTPRLLTLCAGNIEQSKLAVVFQFTYYGAPCIYYGDEIGLTGENDPDNRKCMIWDESGQNRDLFRFYQSMIRLRQSNPALRTGRFRFIHARDRDYRVAYERWDDGNRFIIAMNASPEPAKLAVAASTPHWQEVWTGTNVEAVNGELEILMPGYGYSIFRSGS